MSSPTNIYRIYRAHLATAMECAESCRRHLRRGDRKSADAAMVSAINEAKLARRIRQTVEQTVCVPASRRLDSAVR